MIRPFIYVREKSLRQFSALNNLPVLVNTNGGDLTKERQRAKQLLAQQEILFPKLFSSLRSSVHPLVGFREAEALVKTRRRLKSKEVEESEGETDEEPALVAD